MNSEENKRDPERGDNSRQEEGAVEEAEGSPVDPASLENGESPGAPEGPEVEPDPVKAPGQKTKFSMLLNAIFIDLGTKTGSVEVTINSSNPLFQEAAGGALGRSSIADLNLGAATVTSDSAAHTVSVSGATATLQPLTAVVLNKIFAGGAEVFKPGDPLGVFSFSVTTE